jgi:hypothetical protein
MTFRGLLTPWLAIPMPLLFGCTIDGLTDGADASSLEGGSRPPHIGVDGGHGVDAGRGSRPDTGQVTDAPTADAGLRGDASSDFLTVTSPANGATVAGTVILKGQAGSQWVNIAAYDETNGGAKVSSDTTPSNGAFAISVDTTQLAPGMTSFAITGFSVPPGQLGGTSRSVSLSLDIDPDVGTGSGSGMHGSGTGTGSGSHAGSGTGTGTGAGGSGTFGISPGADIQGLSSADLATTINGMVAAGFRWIRIDVEWSAVEATQGTFDWSATGSDPVIKAAVAAGLHVLALPSYFPSWASTSDSAAYATYLTAAVGHYAPLGVHSWELWNEPNLGSNWEGTSSGTQYAAFLIAGYNAVKAADSTAFVVSAGLSPATDDGTDVAPATFLTAAYAAGAAGHMDAVGMHPYSFPYPPMDPETWNPFYELPSIYTIMEANGDTSKFIWSTELGYPTTFPSDPSNAVTEAQQAEYLTDAFTQLEAWPFTAGGVAFWYNWQDGQDPTGDFGLVSASFAAKPALAASEAFTE